MMSCLVHASCITSTECCTGDVIPTDNLVCRMELSQRTVRFNTTCSEHLTLIRVTYLRANLPLTAESNTIPYPRYLPNFTAAIRHYNNLYAQAFLTPLRQPILNGIRFKLNRITLGFRNAILHLTITDVSVSHRFKPTCFTVGLT